MSKVKFNNGKWMVSTVGLVENTICQLSSKVCVYSDKRVDDDAIPDAHLIAAAPEMYEENENQIKFLRKLIQTFPVNSLEAMEVSDRIYAICSIQAKARGE